MCWFCNGWWPLNNLTCELLGLDLETPYWMSGCALHDVRDFYMTYVEDRVADFYGPGGKAFKDWLEQHNPQYEKILEKYLSKRSELAGVVDVYEYCTPSAYNHTILARFATHLKVNTDKLPNVMSSLQNPRLWENVAKFKDEVWAVKKGKVPLIVHPEKFFS